MVLWGLSILLATLSFFCYKTSGLSFTLPQWLRSRSMPSKPSHIDDKEEEEGPRILVGGCAPRGRGNDGKDMVIADNSYSDADVAKAQEEPSSSSQHTSSNRADDRKAMPPPAFRVSPSPASAPTSQPTPRSPPSPPSIFPALNSAQRASSTTTSRPSNALMPPPRRSPQPPLRSPHIPSPSTRGTLPNRSPPQSSSSSSLMPPPNTLRTTTAGSQGGGLTTNKSSSSSSSRKKIQLAPGHSPLDWAALARDPRNNLSGLPPGTGYLKVPPSLLARMNGRRARKDAGSNDDGEKGEVRDAWTVLSGKVYNITPYAAYHPGGVGELYRCAGRDGTRMFAEVHPWVNWEGMLEGCLVGVAVSEGEIAGMEKGIEELDEMD